MTSSNAGESAEDSIITTTLNLAHKEVETEKVIEITRGDISLPEIIGDAISTRYIWRAFGRSEVNIDRVVANPPVRITALGLQSGRPGEIMGDDAYGTYVGRDSLNRGLTLVRPFPAGYSSDLFSGNLTKVRLGFSHAVLRHKEGIDVRFRRFLLSNLRFRLWPQYTSFPDGGFSADTLQFMLEGSIVRFTKVKGDEDLATMVVEEELIRKYGNRFLRAVPTLLTFLGAVRVDLLKMEAYDSNETLLFEEFYNQDARRRPSRHLPIEWLHQHYGTGYHTEAPRIVGKMLEKYLELDRPLLLTEVVGYIQTSYEAFPEIAFALSTIALDAMCSAYDKYYRPNWDKKMMEEGRFLEIADELKKRIQEVITHENEIDYIERFNEKIDDMNRTGNANKFILFVTELGLSVSRKEKKLFQLRNDAVHRGVLQFDRDSLDYQKMVNSLGEMVTVVNFCFLRLLGYSGLIADYGVIGFPSRWIGDPPPAPTDTQKRLMSLNPDSEQADGSEAP